MTVPTQQTNKTLLQYVAYYVCRALHIGKRVLHLIEIPKASLETGNLIQVNLV
jgi:hypothetical protein